MTVQQILALSQAGFSAEEIERMSGVLTDSAETETQDKAQEWVKDPAPEEPQQTKPAEPTNGPPEWFSTFMEQYNRDFSSLNRQLLNSRVREAEPEGPAPKSIDEIIAEAYAAIK